MTCKHCGDEGIVMALVDLEWECHPCACGQWCDYDALSLERYT